MNLMDELGASCHHPQLSTFHVEYIVFIIAQWSACIIDLLVKDIRLQQVLAVSRRNWVSRIATEH
jgi:hypothetical protein